MEKIQTFMRDLKMRPRLIGALLIAGMVPLVVVAFQASQSSGAALDEQAFNQLTAVRSIKAGQITGYFGERMGDLEVLAANPFTKAALMDLEAGATAAEAAGLSEQTLLQHADYAAAHAIYHPVFEHYMESYGYYDVFLIGKRSGHVVFTVVKEPDFGTHLSSERHHLATAWQEAVSTGRSVLVDMEPYAPSAGAPAMFLATPIREGSEVVGVLALQIPNDQINAIMQTRDGMGETGESYLVGPDKKMRSDSYLDPTGHSVLASMAGTVEANGVDTDAGNRALAGTVGTEIVIDYNGNPVLSAYTPVSIGEHTWALLAEVDVAEAFSPVDYQGKEFYAKYMEMYGYYDLFLVNPDGYCFYTVAKEADYQTNLVNGEYADSGLGQLVQSVLATHEYGMSDFAPYAPSDGHPAAFIAQPVVYDGPGVEIDPNASSTGGMITRVVLLAR